MTAVAHPAVEPVPTGFRIELDASTTETAPGVWLGGQPMRVLRVTAAGRPAWDELRAGPVTTRAGGRLARRLSDAGLAHPVPPPPAGPPDVTVVIPVRNRAAELDRCLTALGDAYPVIVVDDASAEPDAIRAVADRHGARRIRLPDNRGPAGARNAGFAAVTTGLVAFVDSDTVPSGDWIAALAPHLDDPLVAAVAPRIIPQVGVGWIGRFTAAHSALDLGPAPASVRPFGRVSYVPTAALLARRSALAAVAGDDGPFDPRLRVGEDVDLVWRLLAADRRVRYQPDVTVTHAEPRAWAALLQRRFGYGTSSAALAQRHPDNVAPLIVHPWFTATVVSALAGRPVLTAGALGGAFVTTRRAVRRAGLPPRRVLRAVATGVSQTGLGLGRYATQFAGPALLATALLGPQRARVAAATLLLAPPGAGWLRSDRRLDPARYTLASIADDIAYGTGVLSGCLRQRTLRPLVPQTTSRRQQW